MVPKISSSAFVLTISALLYGASTTSAHAYLDPGTGSMILQVLLGGVAGVALVGRLYWHRFLVMVGVRRDAPDAEEAGEPGTGRDMGASKPQAD